MAPHSYSYNADFGYILIHVNRFDANLLPSGPYDPARFDQVLIRNRKCNIG